MFDLTLRKAFYRLEMLFCLAIVFSLLSACSSAPQTNPSTISASQKSERTHEKYRQDILSGKNESQVFVDYCYWAPSDIERDFTQRQNDIISASEAVALAELQTGLVDRMTFVRQISEFLKKNINQKNKEQEEALAKYRVRSSEILTMMKYTSRQLEIRIHAARKRAAINADKGIQSFRNNHFEHAQELFKKALAYDSANAKSLKYVGYINTYFDGAEQLALNRLDAAEARFRSLLDQNIMVDIVRAHISDIRQRRLKVKQYERDTLRHIRNGRFDLARQTLEKSRTINRDRDNTVQTGLDVISLCEQAFSAEQSGDWGTAVTHYTAAIAKWPNDKTLATGLKRAKARKNEQDALAHLTQGTTFLTRGDILESLSHLAMALDLAPKSRKVKKESAQLRRNLLKFMMDLGKKEARADHLVAARNAYRLCANHLQNKTCKRQVKNLEAKLKREIKQNLKTQSTNNESFGLCGVRLLEMAVFPSDGPSVPYTCEAWQAALRRATLYIKPVFMPPQMRDEALETTIRESLETELTAAGIRWDWADPAANEPPPGLTFVLQAGYAGAPLPTDPKPPSFMMAPIEPVSAQSTSPLEMGLLIQLSYPDGRVLAWSFSKLAKEGESMPVHEIVTATAAGLIDFARTPPAERKIDDWVMWSLRSIPPRLPASPDILRELLHLQAESVDTER